MPGVKASPLSRILIPANALPFCEDGIRQQYGRPCPVTNSRPHAFLETSLEAYARCADRNDRQTSDSCVNRITKDALKLTINNVTVRAHQLYIQGVPYGNPTSEFARISYTIENNSGIPLGMAIKKKGVSAGPCGNAENASGLELFDDALAIQLQRNKQYRDRVMRLETD